MMHLSRTRSFQPEAPGGMGSAEPLCLPSRRSTRSSCPRRALGLALCAPALLLLAWEVFFICPSSGVQKSTLLTFGKHLAKCLLLLLAHKHQVGFGTGFGEKKKNVSRYDSAWSFGNNLWPAFLLRSGVFTCAQEQFPNDF